MKKIFTTLFFLGFAVIGANSAFAQLTLPAVSPKAKVSQTVGITEITIEYNRPSVRDREIWGNIVHYGFQDLGFGTSKAAPWRAGADYNTTIEFTHDVKVEGNAVKAGKYGVHMAVEENGEVTVIFSSNTTSWGSFFYDEKEDVLRFKVQSKETAHTEALTFSFDSFEANSTVASLKWEKKEIPFKIEVAVTDIVMAGIENDLRNPTGFQQSAWDQAAGYAFRAGNIEKALEWTNTSIEGKFFSKPNYSNLNLKYQILNQQKKTTEADALVSQMAELGSSNELYGLVSQLITGNKKSTALKVAKQSVKQGNGAWPTNYTLARAYSANGDFKNAIKSLKKSMTLAPGRFKGRLTGELEKLNKKEDITKAN